MTAVSKGFLGILFFGLSAYSACAATITNLSFKVTANGYTNDTISGNGTSPLGITGKANLSQPFLNASDSTITLSNGNYYAIAFLNFGSLSGPGTISFLFNGVTPYSMNVTFPDPSAASPVFADFVLPGGNELTVAATGLSADRIQVSPDGSGLSPDGSPDAFYSLNFTSGSTSTAPEPTSVALLGAGLTALVAIRQRRRKTT